MSVYAAGNEGDYSKAKSYLLTEAKTVFQIGRGVGFEQLMDMATKNGSIERIGIKDENVYEGSSYAVVSFTIYFKDGSQRDSFMNLMKENGGWKISVFAGQ